MKSVKPRVFMALYYRLLVPVIFVSVLLLFIAHQAMTPHPFWSALNFDTMLGLDPSVWVMVVTGVIGFISGSWVWIIKPKSLPALLFAISGFATLVFTFSPLPFYFTTPVSAEVGYFLTRLNMYGASLFGVSICALLLIYPSRLPFHRVLLPLSMLTFLFWTVLSSIDIQRIDYAVQLITFTEMICIIILSVWQILVNKAQADKRAVAIWLSACVIVGSGPFIALVAAPTTFGYEAIIFPSYAFGFFNLLYIGFAIGLLRLRIFDLGSWAFQLVFHAGLAVLFIVIDLVLVSSLTLQKGTALTMTVLVLACIYLPIRGWLWDRLGGQRKMSEAELFQSVIETGLKPSGEARARSWIDLLNEMYKPVQISHAMLPTQGVSVSEDGQSLFLPAAIDAPALVLHQKYEGRALFGSLDQALASQLLSLINQVDGSRRAYDRGVDEERSRIGRDIHDNIGAQLLQALHSRKQTRKDEMIRESLSDLRNVINNANIGETSLADMLADLRAETAERLDNHSIGLNWRCSDFKSLDLPGNQLHVLRSVLREAVSNVIKYSKASQLDIFIHKKGEEVECVIEDNGQGIPEWAGDYSASEGHGLKNMKARIEGLGGEFGIESSSQGTRINATFEIRQAGT